MRFLFLGLFAGIIFGLLPVLEPVTGFEIHPEWHDKLNSIRKIDQSINPHISNINLPPIKKGNQIFLLSGKGYLKHEVNSNDHLTSVSGNGEFYIEYEKVGKTIEFYGIQGDRFWKIKSMEYPYLSYNGRIVLLMNGDHSRIRIVDFNGNEIGVKEINGRLCTSIAFSKYSDFACCGFLDGSHYVINDQGKVIYSDIIAGNLPIKGVAISNKGNFFAIHHGNRRNDFIRVINIRERTSYTINLKNLHSTKTALNITSNGTLTTIDNNRIMIFDRDGDIQNTIKIPEKRIGHSKIENANGIYVASYTKKTGEALFIVFRNDGRVMYYMEFPEEPFLDCFINSSIILLRGSQNLYCYSYSYQ